MEQYIPHIAFGLVFLLVNGLLVLYTLDKLLTVPDSRYVPRHVYCKANGATEKEWFWLPYDLKYDTYAASSGTCRMFMDVETCEQYCKQLDKYGVK